MSKTKNLVMSSITPSQIVVAIQHSINRRRPLMIWGAPGIGKSDIVAQVAKSQNRPLIDIRLPLMEPTDIRGIPYLAEIKVYNSKGELVRDESGVPITDKKFTWSNPSDLPTDEASRALVFFDEMSAAQPSVQAATYQIILNRRIGNYVLPKNVAIVAAGNRVKDKGVAYNMPMPLANRFIHLTLDVDNDDWEEWALSNRIHKDVVGYIKTRPSDLNNFNPSSESYAFASPRSWYFVSELLQELGEDGNYVDTQLPTSVLSKMIYGTVGDGIGQQFMTYMKLASSLPNAKDILDGKVKSLKAKQIDVMYSLSTSLAYEIHRIYNKCLALKENKEKNPMDEFDQKCNIFFKFLMDNFEDELAVMAAKTVLGVYKIKIDSIKTTSWVEFANKLGHLMPTPGK